MYDESTIDKSFHSIPFTVTVDSLQNCYEQWLYHFPSYNYYPCSCNTDRGIKALKVIKTLMEKKFVKIDTVEKFINLMDELVKIA